MYSYFKSEALKMKHTFAGKLIILAPMFTILLSLVLAPMYFKSNCYNQWYSMILPGSISLGCTLVAIKDQRMKNMSVLSLPINLKKVWISKVLVCTAMLIVASMILFLGTLVLGGILNLNETIRIPITNGFVGILVLAIT